MRPPCAVAHCVTLVSSFFVCRDSLAARLEVSLTKVDSEQLARTVAEEQYSQLERDKIMKVLEIKEIRAQHKQELEETDNTIASVSLGWWTVLWEMMSVWLLVVLKLTMFFGQETNSNIRLPFNSLLNSRCSNKCVGMWLLTFVWKYVGSWLVDGYVGVVSPQWCTPYHKQILFELIVIVG